MPRKKETAEETLREHFPPLIREGDPIGEPDLVEAQQRAKDALRALGPVEQLCGTCAAFKPARMSASMGLCKLNPIAVNKGKTDYCLQWAPRPEPIEPAPVPEAAGEESAA